jgi:hypothetical protein
VGRRLGDEPRAAETYADDRGDEHGGGGGEGVADGLAEELHALDDADRLDARAARATLDADPAPAPPPPATTAPTSRAAGCTARACLTAVL